METINLRHLDMDEIVSFGFATLRIDKRSIQKRLDHLHYSGKTEYLCIDKDGAIFLFKDEPTANMIDGEWGYDNARECSPIWFLGYTDNKELTKSWDKAKIQVQIYE